MKKALFLAQHIMLADDQMIADGMECPIRLKVFAHVPGFNSCFYIVRRNGESQWAHATVNYISTLRDRIFTVVYGLCDGSEKYMYDSRNR